MDQVYCIEDEAAQPSEKGKIMQKSFDETLQNVGPFGRYQILLFFATQLGYITVTGSMLCTMFDNVKPKAHCFTVDGNFTTDVCKCSSNFTLQPDFYSILTHLDLLCTNSYVPTLLTTAIMVGGVIGAVIFGNLADRYGRKPMSVASLLGVSLVNGLLFFLILCPQFWFLVMLFFVLGIFGGGYMVVNLVYILEAVGPQWRLFCTSVNGWPFGLMTMSLIGYLTNDWRYYHAVLCLAGIPCVLCLFCTFESPRWLIQHGRTTDAQLIIDKIAKINQKNAPENIIIDSTVCVSPASSDRKYSYIDLMRYPALLHNLLALTYSWFASSVVSFGIYFNISAALPGNRYLNTFLTGLLKGTAGVLPFICGVKFGRKPILIVAVTVASLSCWAAAISYSIVSHAGIHMTAFAVIGASAIDPAWKINHLYSTELFPTVVRNMARAVCNVGSRIGSILGPQMSFLAVYYFPAPYYVFAVLATVQLIVCAFCFPETRNQPLPEAMPTIKHSEKS